MEKYHIELTDKESILVDEIDFESYTHESYLANKQPILALLESLTGRDAIPEQRLKYWNDPDYCTTPGKASHKGVFEGNGCTGDDIYTHPHFPQVSRLFFVRR